MKYIVAFSDYLYTGAMFVAVTIGILSLLCIYMSDKGNILCRELKKPINYVYKKVWFIFWLSACINSIALHPKDAYVYMFWFLFIVLYFSDKLSDKYINRYKESEAKEVELRRQIHYIRSYLMKSPLIPLEAVEILNRNKWFITDTKIDESL